MRFMMRVQIAMDAGNEAARNGTMGATIQSILAELSPEAAYFSDVDGCRGGYIFFEMDNASDLPSVVEPWFLAFNAQVEIHPVMVAEDLAKAAGSIEAAVGRYGSR